MRGHEGHCSLLGMLARPLAVALGNMDILYTLTTPAQAMDIDYKAAAAHQGKKRADAGKDPHLSSSTPKPHQGPW